MFHSQAKDKTAKNRQKIVQSQEKLQHQARQEVRGGGRGGGEERWSNGKRGRRVREMKTAGSKERGRRSGAVISHPLGCPTAS